MSYYYKYNFVSPEPIYALIKEELKSYMDTGAIDDLLFPTYVNKCLQKLGKSSYTIVPYILVIEDFEARLPDNFYAVREAWMCAEFSGDPYQMAGSFYSQTYNSTTIQVSPVIIGGQRCDNPTCVNPECDGCMPEIIQAVYKTNHEVLRSFRQSYMLKPGNISANRSCDVDYADSLSIYGQGPDCSSYDTFDIRDNKFVTNFRNGVVHLIFYASDCDEHGNQLIPDNYRIKEYIEAFIKYKLFEMLTNQTVDETYNQIRQKMMDHKQQSDEAYIMAESEIKKQTAWEKVASMKRQLNSFNRYGLRSGYRGRY